MIDFQILASLKIPSFLIQIRIGWSDYSNFRFGKWRYDGRTDGADWAD
jgi:hypothetical protein